MRHLCNRRGTRVYMHTVIRVNGCVSLPHPALNARAPRRTATFLHLSNPLKSARHCPYTHSSRAASSSAQLLFPWKEPTLMTLLWQAVYFDSVPLQGRIQRVRQQCLAWIGDSNAVIGMRESSTEHAFLVRNIAPHPQIFLSLHSHRSILSSALFSLLPVSRRTTVRPRRAASSFAHLGSQESGISSPCTAPAPSLPP